MTENSTWYVYYKMDNKRNNNNKAMGSVTNPVADQNTACSTKSQHLNETANINPNGTEFSRLCQLITDIYQLIPTDTQYQTSRNQLSKINTSLAYTAPEVVSNYWSELYQFLITYMPDTTKAESENLIWVKKIQQLWGMALQRENTIKRK